MMAGHEEENSTISSEEIPELIPIEIIAAVEEDELLTISPE